MSEGLVVGAVIRGKNASKLAEVNRTVNIINVDILNSSRLSQEIKTFKPQLAFHLAGTRPTGSSWGAIQQAYQNNFTGTHNLLQALQESDCRFVVVVGSIAEYGPGPAPFKEEQAIRPCCAYGASKAAATQLAILAAKMFKLNIIVLRSALVYGPGQGQKLFLAQLIKTLISNQQFSMTGGEQYRDFIYVSDVVDALWLAANSGRGQGGIYNIGSGVSITLKDVAYMVAEQLGKAKLLNIGALPYRKDEQFAYCVDSSRARQILNWSPKTEFSQGIKNTLEWYKGFLFF